MSCPKPRGGAGIETLHVPLPPPPELGDNQGQEPLTRDRSHQPGLDPPGSSPPSPDAPSPPAPPSSSREEDGGSLQTSLLLFPSPWQVPVPSSAPQLGVLFPSLILQPQGSIMSPSGTVPPPAPSTSPSRNSHISNRAEHPRSVPEPEAGISRVTQSWDARSALPWAAPSRKPPTGAGPRPSQHRS